MSILKHSTFRIISAELAEDHTWDETVNRYRETDHVQVVMSKVAHKADFSHVELKPGYLYVRSRAISSRTNDNFDSFPAEEIRKSYQTFIGRPTFVNHNNSNHRRARGVIVDAVLHDDVNPDGSQDLWVECYHEVDAQTFPKLAQAIIAGEVARTSMGCDVEYSICSYCNNKAYTPTQYCAHIPRLKGKRIRRTTASGSAEDILVSEICIGLNFFENSLLVEEPADPTAYVLGVDGIGVTASYDFNDPAEARDRREMAEMKALTKPLGSEVIDEEERHALTKPLGNEANWHAVEPYWQGLHDGQEGEPPDPHEDDPEYAKGYAAGGVQAGLFHHKAPSEGDQERALVRTRLEEIEAGIGEPLRDQELLDALISDAITNEQYDTYKMRWERMGITKDGDPVRGWSKLSAANCPGSGKHSMGKPGTDGVCPICGAKVQITSQGLLSSHPAKPFVSASAIGDPEHPAWQRGFEDGYYGTADQKRSLMVAEAEEDRPHYEIGYDTGHAEALDSRGTNWKRGSIKNIGGDKVCTVCGHYQDPEEDPVQGCKCTGEGCQCKAREKERMGSLDKTIKTAAKEDYEAEAHPVGNGKKWQLNVTHKPSGKVGSMTGTRPISATHVSLVEHTPKWAKEHSSPFGFGTHKSEGHAQDHIEKSMTWRDDEGKPYFQAGHVIPISKPQTTASFGGQRVASINLKDLGGRGKSVGTMKCSACGHSITAHNNDGCKSDDCKKTKEEIRQMDMARSRHTGIGEVVAPPQVDTLRQDACPICGSDDFNGDECPICMYTKPPDQFMDPDLDQAGLQDLRGGDDTGLQEDIMGAQGLNGDLACPECGSEFSGDDDILDGELGLGLNEQGGTGAGITEDQPPSQLNHDPNAMSPANNVPSSNLGEPPAAPKEQLPGPKPDPKKPKADTPPAGEHLPKPSSDDGVKKEKTDDPTDNTNKPSGPLDQANDVGKDPQEPDKEADPDSSALPGEVPDDSTGDDKGQGDEDSHKEGDTCPNCGKGQLKKKMSDDKENPFAKGDGDDDADDKSDSESSNPFGKGDKDADSKDDADSKPDKDDDSDDSHGDDKDKDDKDKKHSPKDDKSKQGMRAISNSPNEVKVAQSSFKVIAAQAAELRAAKAQIADLERKVNYIARAAGLVPRKADVMNPSQPVPAPASEGAHDTTQEAMTPMSRVDVTQIGAAPGATDVASMTTDVVDSIGGTQNSDNAPYDISQTVTAPVAGTEGRRPLDEVRTVPEIQFGDPLKPDAAFPLTGDMVNRPTLAAKQDARTWASIRLAQLRKECGTIDAEEDDLIVAQAISHDTSMSDEHIAYEIETLSQVARRKQSSRNPRTASRSTVPTSREAVRTMPSIASYAPLQTTASAAPADDDQFGWI